jgi:hypothetical protein
MKVALISFLLLLIFQTSFAQKSEGQLNSTLTIGFLQGGGSLIGADLEIQVSDHFGIQGGAGIVGFGAGINYHFKPSIRSSFVSLQYWNQGIGSSFAQNVIGPNYVYRGKKWFTYQIGIGKTLSKGPAWPSGTVQTPIILMYSIGGYFSLKE